ncbi:MAG: protein translocase subunit SecF [Deltaproteobacteria bacterium]|nr:MAG: protein translocase subunit SecF [Deltaproteobacteria bacterium]
MQFIKANININFIGNRKIGYALSVLLIVISIGSLIMNKGLKYGVDFAGGSLLQVKFDNAVKIDDIQSGLNAIGLEKTSVQQFGDENGNEYLVRTNTPINTSEGFSTRIEEALKKSTGQGSHILRVEMVGPQVGKDLRGKALFAIFFSLLFTAIYISGRFELKWILSGVIAAALFGAVSILSLFNVSIPILIAAALLLTLVLFWVLGLKYALGAIVALIHDVIITVGAFSVLGKEFTLPIIAALLTIIGYSLNDTIIVFDRIRENLKKQQKDALDITINKSINETLSRTLLTSLTTLFSVIALYIFGGGIIHDFAFAMIVGILVGTYSSIFIASPILLAWQEE